MITRKGLNSFGLTVVVLLLAVSCSQFSKNERKQKEASKPQEVSAEKLSTQLLISPRPERLDVNRMRTQGRKVIIDMRSPSELTGEVRSLASEYGMTYYNVPFFNPEGQINSDAIEKVGDLVSQAPGESVVHCSSGNRASAWLALYLHGHYDWDIEKAIKEGQAHRLTKEKLMDLIREYDKKD